MRFVRRLLILAVLVSSGCSLHLNSQDERFNRIEATKADAAIVDSVLRQQTTLMQQLNERVTKLEGGAK